MTQPVKTPLHLALDELRFKVRDTQGPEVSDYLTIRRSVDAAIIGMFKLLTDSTVSPEERQFLAIQFADVLDVGMAKLDVAAGLLKFGDQPASDDHSDPISKFVEVAVQHRRDWDAIVLKFSQQAANDPVVPEVTTPSIILPAGALPN